MRQERAGQPVGARGQRFGYLAVMESISTGSLAFIYSVLLASSLLICVLAVPLIQGRVQRNSWYGFRTRRTLASDAVWYPANRLVGKALLVGHALYAVVVLVCWLVAPRLGLPIVFAVFVGMLAAVMLYSYRHTRRLERETTATQRSSARPEL